MRALLLLPLIVVLLLVSGAIFVVEEWQQVVITRFGEPVGDAITEPGLHMKVPFVDKVHSFDKRFLAWDGEPTEVPTKEKRFIVVDTYARWQITDPLLFFKRLRDESRAQRRLDGILNGETRSAVARFALVELVRTSNREPLVDEALGEEEEGSVGLEGIDIGRSQIQTEILANAQTAVSELGITLLDVRFKRINYVEKVRLTVYERMIAERQRIAERFRSEGEGDALRIRGEKERELKRIESEAYREAQEIRGRADAQATQIYADAYDQSADSRDFYAFLKTMETYSSALDRDTTMVLSTDADFLRYLKDDSP
ncbi:MAG: protease modulator HflC [Acidobacteriota bacterium]